MEGGVGRGWDVGIQSGDGCGLSRGWIGAAWLADVRRWRRDQRRIQASQRADLLHIGQETGLVEMSIVSFRAIVISLVDGGGNQGEDGVMATGTEASQHRMRTHLKYVVPRIDLMFAQATERSWSSSPCVELRLSGNRMETEFDELLESSGADAGITPYRVARSIFELGVSMSIPDLLAPCCFFKHWNQPSMQILSLERADMVRGVKGTKEARLVVVRDVWMEMEFVVPGRKL